jgi:lipopolysaccharide transport system ATP-binding protein
MGLSRKEIDTRFEEIVDFSGIRDFIDQPVKTYSSGMYVRLAFSVATSVNPDILVVDEALSVGDGEFARKSFDRIRNMKEQGKTIFFCSHSLYQVEAFCDRVLWLDHGKCMYLGEPQEAVHRYSSSLLGDSKAMPTVQVAAHSATPTPPNGYATLGKIKVKADGNDGASLEVMSGKSEVCIEISFMSDPLLPCPSVAAGFMWQDGFVICSASTHFDQVILERAADGSGKVELSFPNLPLLKGNYWVSVYLLCENGIHVYDCANFVTEILVRQANLEQGIVSLPHLWKY